MLWALVDILSLGFIRYVCVISDIIFPYFFYQNIFYLHPSFDRFYAREEEV